MMALNPCPKCGGRARLYLFSVPAGVMKSIHCTKCRRAHTGYYLVRAKAVRAWNGRQKEGNP